MKDHKNSPYHKRFEGKSQLEIMAELAADAKANGAAKVKPVRYKFNKPFVRRDEP